VAKTPKLVGFYLFTFGALYAMIEVGNMVGVGDAARLMGGIETCTEVKSPKVALTE
jgi:hypothetical protein